MDKQKNVNIIDQDILYRLVPEGVFVVDSESRVVEANDRIFEVFSKNRQPFDGGQFGDVFDCYYAVDGAKRCGEMSACELCPLRLMIDSVVTDGQLVTDEELSHEFEINGRKSAKWFTVNARRITKENKPYGVFVFSDVTDKKVMERELVKLGVTDELTGLFSRKYILQQLEKELRYKNSATYPLSLAMIDLDNFEAVNDAYGEQAGDQVLAVLASMIRRNTRDTDYTGRYGGDSFMLILEKCDAVSAKMVLSRIRESFGKAKNRVAATPSFSAGVAEIGFEDIQASETAGFIEQAETMLKKAKENGKDRFEI